jgi:LPS O-antigen subunit length determinant protein (WzzB/FepE family)
MTEEHASSIPDDDERVDLAALVGVPWRRRRLIGVAVIAGTGAALVYSLLVPRVYLSDGFYQLGNPQPKTKVLVDTPDGRSDLVKPDASSELANMTLVGMPGIPIPLFKASATQFSNPNRLQSFAAEDASLTASDRDDVKRAFHTSADINRWIRPVYAYARDDARDFVQSAKEDNTAIGLDLSFEAHSPEVAARFVGLLGRYVRDCIVYVTLFSYVMDEQSSASAQLRDNENEVLKTQFALQQNTIRMRDVQAILARHPDAARSEVRQVVSIQDGGQRYLSPVTQLVGIESAIVDQRRRLALLERNRERLVVRQRYFSSCASEIQKIGEHGEDLLRTMQRVRSQVFTQSELANAPAREALNDLLIDAERFEHAFYTNCRFISGPTVPSRHVRPSRAAIVLSGSLASLVLSVLYAFGSAWWQKNREAVSAS